MNREALLVGLTIAAIITGAASAVTWAVCLIFGSL